MVTKDDLFRLGKEIRARQTFMVSALTGQNVKLVNIIYLMFSGKSIGL
jgi:hypothetical protein